MNKTV